MQSSAGTTALWDLNSVLLTMRSGSVGHSAASLQSCCSHSQDSAMSSEIHWRRVWGLRYFLLWMIRKWKDALCSGQLNRPRGNSRGKKEVFCTDLSMTLQLRNLPGPLYRQKEAPCEEVEIHLFHISSNVIMTIMQAIFHSFVCPERCVLGGRAAGVQQQ